MNRIGESAFADRVASTTYAEHLKKITEEYILHKILKLKVTSLKFKHKTQAVMAPCTKGEDMSDEDKANTDPPFVHKVFGLPFFQALCIIMSLYKLSATKTNTIPSMPTELFFTLCIMFHVSLVPLTPFFL
jgi:hypothetical protein